MESKTNIDLMLFLNFRVSSRPLLESGITEGPANEFDQWLCTGRLFGLHELSDDYV